MTDYQPSKEVTSGDDSVRCALANGHDLAQTDAESAAHVNGEAQEASFNENYIAPEDEVVEDDEPNDASLGQEARVAVGGVGIGKKKNRKKKPKSKRGLVRSSRPRVEKPHLELIVQNAPSGFEEYYVDAPLTPAEAEEEQGLYHE